MPECRKAEALFEDYFKAAKDCVDAAINLHNLSGSKEQFADFKILATEAYKKCNGAFAALTKHGAQHGCLIAFAEPAKQRKRNTQPRR